MTLYKCPIEVFLKYGVSWDELTSKAAEAFDNDVEEAVFKAGIQVDRDELVKALAYDRGQYQQGHADGYKQALDDVKHLMETYDVSFGPLENLYKEK